MRARTEPWMLGVLSLTMGLTLHVNIGSMLGMIAAFIIYRKM